jgi:hypothetical protein
VTGSATGPPLHQVRPRCHGKGAFQFTPLFTDLRGSLQKNTVNDATISANRARMCGKGAVQRPPEPEVCFAELFTQRFTETTERRGSLHLSLASLSVSAFPVEPYYVSLGLSHEQPHIVKRCANSLSSLL